MAQANIDLFNRFALAVFAKLHDSFPVAVDLDFESIMLSVTPDDWGYEGTFNALASAGEAVNFLESEGFLTVGFKGVDGRGVSQVRLTMKGLAILDAVPTSLEKKESLITSIKAMVKKGLKEAASEQVGDLAKQAIALALASGPALANMVRG
jgi:hypothetical protein